MDKTVDLIIRADANARIGTGHLMRCLALAQAWQDEGGKCIFVTSCDSENLLRRIADEGFTVIELAKSFPDPSDWSLFSAVLNKHPAARVVLDGYHFDQTYQKRIKLAGHRLLVIDDTAHLDHYYADLVLNQNFNAGELNYRKEPYTRLLLGPRYILLRREFRCWRNRRRKIPAAARKVLITMGGSDPDNITLKVIRALGKLEADNLEAVVVAGSSNPHVETLKKTVDKFKGSMRLVENIAGMPGLMAWADLAVSAGGGTCWELAYMGVPLVVVVLSENQMAMARGLQKNRIAYNLGWGHDLSEQVIRDTVYKFIMESKTRYEMQRSGRRIVDGSGAARAVKLLGKQN